METDKLLEKRIQELIRRADNSGVPMHTAFMTMAEQDIFIKNSAGVRDLTCVLNGGFPGAERCVGLMCPEYVTPEEYASEILACVHAEPLNAKFADKMSHRDWLGSIMNLGIERSKVGDIVTDGTEAWIICLSDMADYISEQLLRVRHTNVSCSVCRISDLPEDVICPKPTQVEGSVASIRIDSILSLAFGISRSKAVPFISGEQVYVNGRLITSSSFEPQEGDIISVRHMGRAVFAGCQGTSKKGRLFVKLDVYK